MKKIMFNDRYHLTEAVLEKHKRQTRRIESRQRKENVYGGGWDNEHHNLSIFQR